LRLLQLHDAEENLALKSKFHALQTANDVEKKQLEAQMKHVIHSQAGQLVSQRQKITHLQQSLQGELMISQNKIAEQEKEIKWLKRLVVTDFITTRICNMTFSRTELLMKVQRRLQISQQTNSRECSEWQMLGKLKLNRPKKSWRQLCRR
jgi:hypothetical protein